MNKVNSKAILFWSITENTGLPKGVIERFKTAFASRINQEGVFVLQSERFRDKPQNIRDCQEKLKDMVMSVWLAPKKRKPTKPSRAANERRIQSKKGRSDTKKNRQKISY